MNEVIEKGKNRLKLKRERQIGFNQPELYEVYLHNDDFTPMGFVIEALMAFFHMDDRRAKQVTLEAHTKGVAVCGVYCRDIAETRIDRAAEHARMNDHPLRWSMIAT